MKLLGKLWGTKHCKHCNKQTNHDVLRSEKLGESGYPLERKIWHKCCKCSEVNIAINWEPIPTHKFDILHELNEPQLEWMETALYNGENFRNYIELRDKISNEQKKLLESN